VLEIRRQTSKIADTRYPEDIKIYLALLGNAKHPDPDPQAPFEPASVPDDYIWDLESVKLGLARLRRVKAEDPKGQG
jgi:hypothetical protein